jgi:hypothetical protein
LLPTVADLQDEPSTIFDDAGNLPELTLSTVDTPAPHELEVVVAAIRCRWCLMALHLE